MLHEYVHTFQPAYQDGPDGPTKVFKHILFQVVGCDMNDVKL